MDIQHVDAFRTITEEDEQNGLIIRWAGHYFKDKADSLDRVHTRYYFVYVYEGKGYILNNRSEQETVVAGSIILFKPGERQRLWADKDDPLSHYGTCFCGRVIDSLLRGTRLCEATHHPCALDKTLLSQMESFLSLMLLHKDDKDKLMIASKFFSILARANAVIEVNQSLQDEKKRSIEDTLDLVEQYLLINYNREITIDDLAKLSNYSVTWLNSRFKERFGTTPIQYLTQVRILKAQKLLCMTEGAQMNVTEIGYAVGYKDSLYFSKVFKKLTGFSPKQYRMLYQDASS